VHEGVLASGGVNFDAPQHSSVRNGEGIGYVRPHDLDVQRYVPGQGDAQGVVAKLRRAHAIGPLAQLDLERADNNELIEAVMSNDLFSRQGFKEGDTLVVKPRRIEVFVDAGEGI
jgi:sulfate transport system ATP-binding protein